MTALSKVIELHKSKGKFVSVEGVNTFILDQGRGEVVFFIHGVPTSSFLYRKIIEKLAEGELRGVCIDLPGLGLSDRPDDFDYSFTGLSDFLGKIIQKLGIEKFHLVVHDIGGPIGFSLAADFPDQVCSITILNTWIDVVNFKKPLPMRPFEKPFLGEVELKLMNYLSWNLMFRTMGVEDFSGISNSEINAYVDLLKRKDGGKAFLKIMRSFDHSESFRNKCYKAVKNVAYPIQAIWGAKDPGLSFDRYGKEIQGIAGIKEVFVRPAKHLLPEEEAPYVAMKIKEIVSSTSLENIHLP